MRVQTRTRGYNLQDALNVSAWKFAGTPVNGTSGTFAGKAIKGQLLVDTTGAKLYINTNTLASPTWTVVGSQS